MRQIETTFDAFGAKLLLIGLKGENNATEILIDCADALEEYQGTMAAMSITAPDGTVYPGDITLDEDGIVHWIVPARDCSIEGHGSARVDLVDDDGTVVASAEATTIIVKTNMQNIAPDQITDWTDAASVALQEVRAALVDLISTDETAEANEAARQLAESGRVSSEQTRIFNENGRVAAESNRGIAETGRSLNETGRVNAESQRAQAETGRANAESQRVQAETGRANAETARVQAETGRISAEQLRVSAENLRTSAETGRANAESQRVQAETGRANAESQRVQAETGRANAESQRVQAETGRVNAETARVSEFDTIRANAQAALSYIGPNESTSTASAAHAVGTYFIYNGELYKATAAIVAGDTIAAGTNCTQVTGGVMGEVSDLKSAINEDRLLFVSEIEDTVQTLTRDSSGAVTGMIHSRSGNAVRTDTYVKANGIFTETRTLASGKYITLVTDLSTKVTTISDVQEAA